MNKMMHVRLSSSTLRFRCAAPPALLSQQQQQPFITGRHYTTRSLLSFHHPSSLSLSSSSSSHSSLLLQQQQQQQKQREEQQEQIERYRDENEHDEKVEEKTSSSENHDDHSDEMRTKSNVKNDKHFLQPDQHPSLISSLRSAFSRQEYDDDTMMTGQPFHAGSPAVQSKLKRDHQARAQNQPDGVLRRSARSVTHVFAYFSQNYYLIAFSFLMFLLFYILDPVSLRNERRNLSARAKREEREM